jgi:hypothetical protein
MAAGTYNFAAEQGATMERIITYKDSAGALVNLTSYTARMQIRVAVETATFILELTTANGGITLGGALGTISLLVSAAVMSSIAAATYVYDLEIVSPSGKVTRLIEGKFAVKAEVTR